MTNLQSTYIESRSLWKSLSARIRGVRRLAFNLHPGVKLSRADFDNSWQQTGIPTDHCCWVTRIVRWLCWIWCLENILGKVSVMKRVPWCVCATSHYLSDWRATFLSWFFKSHVVALLVTDLRKSWSWHVSSLLQVPHRQVWTEGSRLRILCVVSVSQFTLLAWPSQAQPQL